MHRSAGRRHEPIVTKSSGASVPISTRRAATEALCGIA
jgi:hypothetical protein